MKNKIKNFIFKIYFSLADDESDAYCSLFVAFFFKEPRFELRNSMHTNYSVYIKKKKKIS